VEGDLEVAAVQRLMAGPIVSALLVYWGGFPETHHPCEAAGCIEDIQYLTHCPQPLFVAQDIGHFATAGLAEIVLEEAALDNHVVPVVRAVVDPTQHSHSN
jgi:hypothetical protein